MPKQMFIFEFTITNDLAEVTLCYVYAKSKIGALINLELVTGADEYEIDYLSINTSNDPMNYDDTDSVLIKSN